MKVKRKSWQQVIPGNLEEVWEFFSWPENLNKITPESMLFEILTDLTDVAMYPGMIIQYKISPFLGIKMDWVTEITQVRENQFFIDEQRFGPYAFWHHQHHFERTSEGVLMTDILHYKIPYGPIGSIANGLFVEKMVDKIFSYRKSVIAATFSE